MSSMTQNMSYVKLKRQGVYHGAQDQYQQDKLHGRYHRLNQLPARKHSLEQVSFPLYLLRQTCTNADGSTAVRYLVTSDSALTADQLKRWKVEHRER